jgi:hypothetical protein
MVEGPRIFGEKIVPHLPPPITKIADHPIGRGPTIASSQQNMTI